MPTPLPLETSSVSRMQVRASMVGVALALLMGSLDQTIVATAMPRIVAELQGFAHYSGVVSGYLIASTVAIPIAGRLSDLFGRKNFFVGGVLLFTLASVLCGTAASMGALIAWRCLQGLGGGTLQAMAFATIADLFAPAKRGKVSGMMGAMFGLSSVIGPTLGGYLTDALGWRSIFVVNLPVGIITTLVLLRFFPALAVAQRGRHCVDLWGSVTLVSGVGCLLLALSLGGRDVPWYSVHMATLLCSSFVLLALFIVIERRAVGPIVEFSLWALPVVARSLMAAALIAFALMGTTLFIPLFLQAVVGVSAKVSGTALIPMSLSTALASFATGQLVQRTGRTKPFHVAGSIIAALGLAMLTTVSEHSTLSDVTHCLVVLGLGTGMTMPIFSLIVQNAVPPHKVGAATASVQFTRAMGGSLGVALMGALLAYIYSSQVHVHLERATQAHISAEQRSALDDPQQLLRPHTDHVLQHALGLSHAATPAPGPMADAWLDSARISLAQAMRYMFGLALIFMLMGVWVTCQIEELPLRVSNKIKKTV